MLPNRPAAGNISKPEGTSAAAFRRVADLLPDALLLVRLNGKVEAANAAGAALFNLDPAALPEKHLTDFAVEGAANLQAYLQACARSTSLLPGAITLVNHSGLREPC